jgi:hypothetical protein
MNSDIELLDKSILKMVDYLKNNSNIGLIGPKFLNPDLTPQASVFRLKQPQMLLGNFGLVKKMPIPNTFLKLKNLLKLLIFPGGCLLLQKSFFKKLVAGTKDIFSILRIWIFVAKSKKTGKKIVFLSRVSDYPSSWCQWSKLADAQNQWRRLIPSSIKFHGFLKHYFINLIIWSGQKWQKLKK